MEQEPDGVAGRGRLGLLLGLPVIIISIIIVIRRRQARHRHALQEGRPVTSVKPARQLRSLAASALTPADPTRRGMQAIKELAVRCPYGRQTPAPTDIHR
jgi:hypothetical protein